MVEGRELDVEYYETQTGTAPFKRWREGIRDAKVRQAVDARIARFRTGNLGVSRSVGEGVRESEMANRRLTSVLGIGSTTPPTGK